MYCTQADIQVLVQEATLAQLTDDSRTGVVDPTKVVGAVATADAVIDGFLLGRYTLPLVTVPTLIMAISRDLAIYELYSRRLEGGIPEAVETRAENARTMLLQIQKGTVSLGVSSPDAQVGGNALVNKTEADRVFGPDTLAGY